MWQAKKTCLSSRNSANPVIGYYHVRCFENLLDLLSPHYVARFEVDRDEYPPGRGAEDVFEKYISLQVEASSIHYSIRQRQGRVVKSRRH